MLWQWWDAYPCPQGHLPCALTNSTLSPAPNSAVSAHWASIGMESCKIWWCSFPALSVHCYTKVKLGWNHANNTLSTVSARWNQAKVKSFMTNGIQQWVLTETKSNCSHLSQMTFHNECSLMPSRSVVIYWQSTLSAVSAHWCPDIVHDKWLITASWV